MTQKHSPKRTPTAEMTIAVPLDLSTVIVFVFLRLARAGVMSIPEAVRLVDELSETPDLPDEARLHFHIILCALLDLDVGLEQPRRH